MLERHFTPFSRARNITRGTGLCPKLSREAATSIEVQAGIRSRKRVWSAPPSSTVLARETISYKKEHTLEKRKVPSVTACTQRTHENRQTIGETFSLIHFSSPSSLYYYPFALNLYAWNEIFFLETFLSTDLRRRSHWTMETTPRTTTALNSNNPVRNRSIDSVEKDDRFKLRPRWSCIILKNNFLHFFPSPFVERESNNKIKFKYIY